MALGGDFTLFAAEAVEVLPAPEPTPSLSPEETLAKIRERYDLTPREAEVLRELVLTEDKQTVISERLNIQVKTLQDYVTRLYRKTGVTTRAGLTDLYHENRRQT
ncbi:MAG: response regulator transcription factor [Oscillospiraceae bacterium]|nr:response regulator transcription factor [Oscillospiraceae bacterium]